VALRAIMAEIELDVIGIDNPIVIALMATVAIKRRILVAAGMAANALQGGMGSRKGKAAGCMVKCRRRPGLFVMT